ncbi:6-hydroxy-D-nicotine oxidase [Xylariaceae sp. FL1272]|nr:6-hydroxy-D-nicotine oxidase [Xylariaceae sp. FL1272]
MSLHNNSAATTRASAACAALSESFPGQVTLPGSPEYELEEDKPWSQTCWLPAACFVRPSNAQEVAACIGIVKDQNSKFAVRSSAHHSNANFNSVDRTGVVIDVGNLKTLSLIDGNVVQVGAGVTFGELYDFVEAHGLYIVGARNLNVSISGFMLGAGMPAFPNLHGLPVDSVVNYEVVLADGSIVSANKGEKSDLYQTLKGGGPNYGMSRSHESYLHSNQADKYSGVVTRFDLQAYPMLHTQYTVNVYDPVDYVNILKATIQVQEAMELDPKIGLFVNFQPGACSVGLLYADTPAEPVRAFDPFLNLESLISSAVPTTNGTIKSLVASIAYQGPSARRTQSTATTKFSLELYVKAHEAFLEADSTSPADLFYTIQPISTSAVDKGIVTGPNILGLDRLPQTWWAISGVWTDAQRDQEVVQSTDDLRRRIEQIAKDKGELLDFVFMNDGSPTQTVLESYGAHNIQTMKDVAAKYDPDRVFQRLQNDGVSSC